MMSTPEALGEIVFGSDEATKEADVIDAVADHRHALDTQTKSKSRVLFGIIADTLEHRRVDHTCPTDFDPTCPLAHAAGT